MASLLDQVLQPAETLLDIAVSSTRVPLHIGCGPIDVRRKRSDRPPLGRSNSCAGPLAQGWPGASVHTGDVIEIYGASGCGKATVSASSQAPAGASRRACAQLAASIAAQFLCEDPDSRVVHWMDSGECGVCLTGHVRRAAAHRPPDAGHLRQTPASWRPGWRSSCAPLSAGRRGCGPRSIPSRGT